MQQSDDSIGMISDGPLDGPPSYTYRSSIRNKSWMVGYI